MLMFDLSQFRFIRFILAFSFDQVVYRRRLKTVCFSAFVCALLSQLRCLDSSKNSDAFDTIYAFVFACTKLASFAVDSNCMIRLDSKSIARK